MSISITSSKITINNETVSFDDIYQYAVSNNKTAYIQKLGDFYNITPDLFISNGGSVTDTNVSVTIQGDLIQIDKTSELRLGEKRANGSTLNGCTLNAPNISNSYGFGNTTKTNSGNLFLYNSTVNVFGFWGFFSGNNHVEIIDCFIDGFGRIEGSQSILKNIIFKKSHGRYGILSPKGTIGLMENLSVYDATHDGSNNAAVYHNPQYAFDLDIYYGVFDGYTDLAYIENKTGHNTLKFKGGDIRNGYGLIRTGTNVDVFHQFRFKPQVLSSSGSKLSNASVKLVDNEGIEVFNGFTDQDGIVDVWVTYYEDKPNLTPKVKTPHTLAVSDSGITLEGTLYIDRNMEDFPLYLVGGSGGTGGDCDTTSLETKITDMESSINQLISGLGDKIDATQQEIQLENNMGTIII